MPSLQQHILNASGNLDSMPSELEALMFTIYCAAIRSLSDEEVLQGFGKSRTALLAQYQQASQSALIKAGLLKTSNMVVLQAFVIFIVSFPFLSYGFPFILFPSSYLSVGNITHTLSGL